MAVLRAPEFPPYKDWHPMARTLNEIGRQLQTEFGVRPIPTSAIRRALVERKVHNPDWIQPSDFAYNLWNAGFDWGDFNGGRYPIFEQVARGKYRYLGPHYPYEGAVMWAKRGQAPRKVGEWVNGALTLYADPQQ